MENDDKDLKEDPINGQNALNNGLLTKLNDQVSTIIKEGPEKYEEKKDPEEDDEEDENGYLKTCHNLSRLYNNLVHNDMDNVDKFNNMGITDNTLNMLDHFNDKVEPKTEEEKLKDKEPKNKENIDDNEYEVLTPKDMVRDIMKNCAGTLEQITVPPKSNEFLANKTTFGDTMNNTLENDNNDNNFINTSLHALGNHLYTENGKNYSKLDLPRLYKLLKNLQSK